MHENVGDFQISVDHILLSEVRKSLKYVSDDGGCLCLIEVAVLSQSRFEISFSTELSDNIAVAVAGKYLEALEDIGMA